MGTSRSQLPLEYSPDREATFLIASCLRGILEAENVGKPIYKAWCSEHQSQALSITIFQLCTHAFLGILFRFPEHAMRSFEMVSFDEATQSREVTSASSYILQSHHATRYPLTIQDVTTLPELFKWQAQRRCDATLFSFRISPDASLTTGSYAEAYETSSQLVNSLHSFHE